MCSSENFKEYNVAYNNTAKKMLIISASVLLQRGDKVESCEFLSTIFCKC